MPHADEGRLHAYLDGALHAESPEDARALERHLERCDDCRALLDFERAVRDEAADLLASAVPAAATAAPPWGEILHRAGRGEGGGGEGTAAGGVRVRPGYGWLPAGHRLAWAASLVAALGVGWWAHAALGFGPFDAPTASRPDSEAATAGRLATGARPEPSAPAAPLGEADGRRADGGEARASLETEVLEAGRPAREAAGAQDRPGDTVGSDARDTDRLQPAFRDAREEAGVASGNAEEAAREAQGARSDDAPPASPDALGRAEAREEDEALAPDAAAVPTGAARKSEPAAAPDVPILVPDRPTRVPEGGVTALRAAPEAFARDAAAPAWTAVGLGEARALLGTAPVGIPGADVLELAWGAGGRTLRLTQRLATGERIDLYQWRADREGTAGPVFGDDPGDPPAQRERGGVAGQRSRPPLSMVSLDGLLVAGSGLVEPAVLRELLQGLEPLD